MPFLIPSKLDLLKRARNAFRAEMPGTDAWLWPSNTYVTAKVIGGAVWELFGRLAWIEKQRFAMTATKDQLDLHAKEWGLGRKPATYASGSVEVPATFPFTVPKGTTFTRSDGLIYTSTADTSLLQFSNSDVLSVPVVCNTIGKTGNLAAGAPLTCGLSGITGSVVVDDNGIGQGANIETDTYLRERILARKRQPPQGGASYDYVAWAKTLPGVTRVFVAGNAFGPGTVAVWFLMDDTYAYGIPQATDVAAVQAYIDTVRPTTADVIVMSPTLQGIDVVVQGLTPDTTAVRQAVGAELFALFRNMVQPGIPDEAFTLRQQWIWTAVANASGQQYATVLYPNVDLTFSNGVMPCLNSVSFVTA